MKQIDVGLFRGPHTDPAELAKAGITMTLDLESGKQVLSDDSPLREALACNAVGIRTWAHPLGAILPPSVQELTDAAQFMAKYNKNLYVHCHYGVDRTGMVCAAYRILIQQWPVTTAIKEMLAEGFHLNYFYWLPQLWRLK